VAGLPGSAAATCASSRGANSARVRRLVRTGFGGTRARERRSRWGAEDPAKREVDPLGLDRSLAWNRMTVVMLGAAAHPECNPVAQAPLARRFWRQVRLGLHQEPSRRAERERKDRWILAEFGFVVGVPAHRVLAVAIAVDEHVVEGDPSEAFDAAPDRVEASGPGLGCQGATRIAVGHFARPSDESGFEHLFAEEPNRPLLPGRVSQQTLEQRTGRSSIEPGWLVNDPSAFGEVNARRRCWLEKCGGLEGRQGGLTMRPQRGLGN